MLSSYGEWGFGGCFPFFMDESFWPKQCRKWRWLMKDGRAIVSQLTASPSVVLLFVVFAFRITSGK